VSALVVVAFAPVTGSAGERPIQDNSFLIEEAYNQEPGVVQHISTFQRSKVTGDWFYTLTDEWPAPGQNHQIGVTIPVQGLGSGGGRGIGDVALNYRYQLAGSGEARLACAPRLSVSFPSGDAERGFGLGGSALQVNIPVSMLLNEWLVTHFNIGGTYAPSTHASGSATGFNVGQSLIYLLRPTFNLMLEAAFTEVDVTTGGTTDRTSTMTLNPGFRAAHNFGSVQIVGGVALPLGLGPSRGDNGVLLYLSFEHPLGREANPEI
jgi:hypothetical protein